MSHVHCDLLSAPHKQMSTGGVADSVVELSNAVLAQRGAEAAKAAALLGNSHREYRLALFADFGALGYEAQTVKIEIGARNNCSKSRPS